MKRTSQLALILCITLLGVLADAQTAGELTIDLVDHRLSALRDAGAGDEDETVLLTPLAYIPVGHIDIEICDRCGGAVKIIACIEDPVVIEKILTHLDRKATGGAARRLPVPPENSIVSS